MQTATSANAVTIMVQGTASDAGKSMLVAGICRCIQRRGIAVAPFKPQNMALNSAVTAEGGEIGRAQAVQAQAAKVAPHVDMNPILLKPSSDTGAQVIVHGKAIGNMQAAPYHEYKSQAMQAVLASHKRLSEQYQVIVVEGAGSPAEINLRDRDIANMGFAEAVDCPVLLVADIDKGGVFAQCVGTLDLLSESEQARIIGFVINKFRGDINLLTSGLDWLENRSQKPVIGVLPYLHNLQLAAEDAIQASQALSKEQIRLRVAVPVFSRISNHTDFDMLRSHPQVELIFVGQHTAIPPCDLIILPGSKNVRSDLELLRSQTWQQDIAKHLRYGGKVLGICGGYQMLGRYVADPNGIEGTPGTSQGLGYLPIDTELAAEKQLIQNVGELQLLPEQPVAIKGYQIHVGISTMHTHTTPVARTFAQLDNISHHEIAAHKATTRSDGCISADNQVAGTYLHGLFDTPEALQTILAWAGAETDLIADYQQQQEREIDRLADACEQHLNWSIIDKYIKPV